MSISALPTPPLPTDITSVFNSRAFALLSALPTFVTEANVLQTDVNAKAVVATDKAVLTAADRVQTGLDRVQTGLDRVQTGLDAVAAAAMDKRYLGAKAAAPTLDNQGLTLATGAVYYDTTLAKVRTWNGSAWVEGISAVAGVSSVNGQSGDVTVQPTLVSGTNIKTVNGSTLLGSGDLVIASGVTSFNGLTGAVSYDAQDLYVHGVRIGRGGGGSNTSTAIGYTALSVNTTGAYNIAIGYTALSVNTTGYYNTAVGNNSLNQNTTGLCNTAIGINGLVLNTTGSTNIQIGGQTHNNGYDPVFSVTTENNRVVMGSHTVTNAYIQVAWTVVSDARDKTDFAPVPHGLDFVCALQPTAYRFRKSRDVLEADGPLRYGFKAQDVLALEGTNPVIVDADDADKLRFNDSSLIPVLVKAIQELRAEFNAYKASRP